MVLHRECSGDAKHSTQCPSGGRLLATYIASYDALKKIYLEGCTLPTPMYKQPGLKGSLFTKPGQVEDLDIPLV